MARAITNRPVELAEGSSTPNTIPQPVTFWDKPLGIDLVTPVSRLGVDKTPAAYNYRVDMSQRLTVRNGYVAFGSAAPDEIVGLALISTRGGIDYYLRVTQSGVEIAGTNWTALSGDALNLPSYAIIEFAAWGGDIILFTDGINGLWAVDLGAGTYTLVPGAPVAKHLAVFGGRVILSNVGNLASRIQWSVKNDYLDWGGIGSGFDDMLSGPGGIVDVQHGVFPVTDQEAFVVRSSSIWIMTLTGDVDAPFLFSYRFSQGTDSPRSIVIIPGAQIMMVGRDDVVIVSTSGVQPVGTMVRSSIVGPLYQARNAQAVWDKNLMEYRLWVPPSTVIWRFHTPSGTWMQDVVAFIPRRLAQGNRLSFGTISELVGTIGGLSGPIGELGVQGRSAGILIAASGGQVVKETAGATTDYVDSMTTAPIVALLTSGIVIPGGPLQRASVIAFELELIASRAMAIGIEVSVDGDSWAPYGTLNVLASPTSQVLMFRNTIDRNQYLFRLNNLDAAGLRLIAAHLYGYPSGPRNL